MKRCVASVSAIAVMLWVGPALAQQKAKAQNVAEIPYTSVPNFLKLPPGEYLGESVGVATNSKGHVFVFHRSANTRLFEFDENGNFLKEIGKGYYGFEFAHSVRVDPQDNIWTVDEGTNMVTKFSPDGKVLMVIGRRPPPIEGAVATPSGPNKPAEKYIFCRPTDVGWDPQGNIFVSDGYCNNRVVKFDKDGRFLAQVGSEKAGKEPGEFNLPHGLQVDRQGNVYVADRGNRRIQVFDEEGKFLRQITIDVPVDPNARPAIGNKPPATVTGTMAPGAPWAICITPGPNQVLYSSDAFPGRIYKLSLEGKVMGVLGESGKQLKQFGWIHEIACPSENELYVGELLNWRVQKLILEPNH